MLRLACFTTCFHYFRTCSLACLLACFFFCWPTCLQPVVRCCFYQTAQSIQDSPSFSTDLISLQNKCQKNFIITVTKRISWKYRILKVWNWRFAVLNSLQALCHGFRLNVTKPNWKWSERSFRNTWIITESQWELVHLMLVKIQKRGWPTRRWF